MEKWAQRFVNKCENCMTTLFKTHLMNGIESGLYLIGQSNIDPFTKEISYWVKVGLTTNPNSRFSSYRTCSPTILYIDWIEIVSPQIQEPRYHAALNNICLKTHQDEWFQITEAMYLNICNSGFKTVNILLDAIPEGKKIKSNSQKPKKYPTRKELLKEVEEKTKPKLFYNWTTMQWDYK